VAQVNPGSPAAEAGIRRGSLIQEVNQQSVHSTKDFMKALAESAKTKRVLLLLQDQGGTRFVALSLG
jgi:serine protease Do